MAAHAPTDPEWAQIRAMFDELLDLPAPDRAAALAARSLSASVHTRLARLLAAHDRPEQLLVLGSPIPLPAADAELLPLGSDQGGLDHGGLDGGLDGGPDPHAPAQAEPSAPESLLGPQGTPPPKLGRYILDRQLGRGGMGEVWLAHDSELDRDVAIKVLADQWVADPQWLARFRDEARAAGGLNHPRV